MSSRLRPRCVVRSSLRARTLSLQEEALCTKSQFWPWFLNEGGPEEHDVYSLVFLICPRSSGAPCAVPFCSYMPLLAERNE